MSINWSIYAALTLTGFLLGGGLVMGIYAYVYGSPLGGDPLSPEASVLSSPTVNSGPAPKVVRLAQDPIEAAKQLKPLSDIQKEDRVIYQGTACKWVEWSGDDNTSVIKCPGKSLQQIQTIQLTPVEGRGIH